MNFKIAWLLSLAWLAAVQPFLTAQLPGLRAPTAEARVVMPPKRFTFTIDPKTPTEELLPAAPTLAPPLAPWLVRELRHVPEVFFEKVVPTLEPGQPADFEKLSAMEQQRFFERHSAELDKAMRRTAHGIAKINHLNKEGTDQFLKTLLRSRPDLVGLPFVMGDDCRSDKKFSAAFLKEVQRVREGLRSEDRSDDELFSGSDRPPRLDSHVEPGAAFWATYNGSLGRPKDAVADTDIATRARVAALSQMLAAQPVQHRLGLVKHLAGMKEAEATKALTSLALFSVEDKLRDAALAALKERRDAVDGAELLRAVRYPWPAVARNAATAIIQLERRDLVPELVKIFDEPDPRAPVVAEGKKPVVRELVRLNHHHNCLLCHAPGNMPDVKIGRFGGSSELVTGAVPSPGQSLPRPSQGYDRDASPDILVRIDVNYLRQDFSVLQSVGGAAPWPEMQRFDFLVRTREVRDADVEAYRRWRSEQPAGYLTPNQDAALAAVRAFSAEWLQRPDPK